MRGARHVALVAAVVALLVVPLGPAAGQGAEPICAPGGEPVTYEGEEGPDDAGTFRLLPFDVAPATTRVEVDYDWGEAGELPGTPLTSTTVDLGLWDEAGPYDADGFRGWSGSRHREIHVQADAAERGYLAGPVEPGVWHVELGIAAVGPEGGWWEVEIRCLDPDVGEPPLGSPPDPYPVDPRHVARDEPGWYHGDLHMHAYHSHPDAPDWDGFVAFAREQGLDFLPITEYTTTAHWYELGAVQDAHPDLVVWPGREIITYQGHAITLGETWGHVEYRHGHGDITMREIQAESVARDALFQVAHPTTFEGPLFENFCRGCAWELADHTDWDAVDTIEVLTGPPVAYPGGDQDQVGFENPFMTTAIAMWEDLLNDGHRITAVGGSDDKWAGERTDEFGTISPHGVPATAVYAEELSRPALEEALRAGRAYVRTRGVHDSPALEMTATAPGGEQVTFGGSLAADVAEITVTVRDGSGQVLVLVRNGDEQLIVPVVDDDFEHTFTADRDEASEGPLGTWWRLETRDAESRTTIGNPIFLTDAIDEEPAAPDRTPIPTADPAAVAEAPLPATGGGGGVSLGLLIVLGALAAMRRDAQVAASRSAVSPTREHRRERRGPLDRPTGHAVEPYGIGGLGCPRPSHADGSTTGRARSRMRRPRRGADT